MEAIINGKKYKLIPIEEEPESVLDGYKIEDRQEIRNETAQEVGNSGVKRAIPTVSEYRERYKQRKVKMSETVAPPRIIDIEDKTEGMLEGYEYKGESLFFGKGLEQDIG